MKWLHSVGTQCLTHFPKPNILGIRDHTDLESLVTEEPRDIGDLDTRGEGGGAIGVTEHPLRLASEIMMRSRLFTRMTSCSVKWVYFFLFCDPWSVLLSHHLTQAHPECRVFYWELVIDIAEVWVTNSSAYLHMITGPRNKTNHFI